MRDLTFTELERLETTAEADEAFHMDEETFRAFYERTSRPVGVPVLPDGRHAARG